VFLHTLRIFRSPLVWPWCIYASYNAHTGRPWTWSICVIKSNEEKEIDCLVDNSLLWRVWM